jgi:hypothetical protein
MSWDIFVQDFPPDAATFDDVPNDFVPASIGKRSEIIRIIKDVAPSADFSDPSWGKIDGDKFSIELSLGNDEELGSFAFHVRGDNEAAAVVSEILIRLKLRAFDTGTGEFFDHSKLRPASSDGESFGIG